MKNRRRRNLSDRCRDESGIALIIALMSLLLLTALGMALVLTTSTETMIAGNFSTSGEGFYAADAGIERSMQDVLAISNWNNILAGSERGAFVDGVPGVRTLPGGGTLDLTQVVNMANCGHTASCSVDEMNAVTPERPWGLNNPRWQLFSYGPLNDIIPTATVNSPFYVVVMIGDDGADATGDPPTPDNNPLIDSNGVLAMRAEAFGPGGAHKIIEVTLAQTNSAEMERGYIGQRGQDEQNRRARKAAVQTTGKGLTVAGFSTGTGGQMVGQ